MHTAAGSNGRIRRTRRLSVASSCLCSRNAQRLCSESSRCGVGALMAGVGSGVLPPALAGAADGAQLAEGHRAAVLLEGPPDVQQPPERVLDLLLLAQLVREARPLWRLDADDVLLARRRRREGEEALVDQLLRHAVVCLEGGGVGVHLLPAARRESQSNKS